MSPNIVGNWNADGFIVDSDGRLKSEYMGNNNSIRPVVSLKKGIEFASG